MPISGNSRVQCGAALGAEKHEPTSDLARRCREAIKEDLEEERAVVLATLAGAGKSIREIRRNCANRKTKKTALRNRNGTTTASSRRMEKLIHDFYSDLFDSYVHLPPHRLTEDGDVIPEILPTEVRHAIMSMKNRTLFDSDRIKSEHKNEKKHLPLILSIFVEALYTLFVGMQGC
ncbi:hypothetical protein RB195_025569 [Necator americanus]|uniref:Uncharacterized protein n=1 Tax=Necator americanus TaxID=51031 RepID=A0ABR1ESW3_NECAM